MSTEGWGPRPRDEVLARVRIEGDRRLHRRRSMLTAGVVALVVLLAVPVVAMVADDERPPTAVHTADDTTTTTSDLFVEETTTTSTTATTAPSPTTTAAPKPARTPTTRSPAPYTGELLTFVDGGNSSRETTKRDVLALHADGTGLQVLFTAVGPVVELAWSPDGSKAAYLATTIQGRDLYVVDRAGRDHRRIFEGGPGISQLTWRPDGKAIGARADGAAEFDTATGEHRVLVANASSAPSWSPDGKSIAYSVTDVGERGEAYDFVYTMDLATNETRRLTNRTQGSESMPKWSPDGSVVAFTIPFYFGPPASTLAFGNPKDPKLWQTQNSGGGSVVTYAWSPDGTRFIVSTMRYYRDTVCCGVDVFTVPRGTEAYRKVFADGIAVGWAPKKP